MSFHDPDSIYHIFFQIVRLHYSLAHSRLERIGVHPGQPPMLFALLKKDGQSQKDLSKRLRVKPATITVMLSRMEKAELVERRQDSMDQRILRVYLTEKGREKCLEAMEIMKGIESECFSNFTDEERMLLRRLLMQMRDNLLNESEEDIDCNC